ncbi:MAG: hypoxanthine phosphoribosyltransferase [Mycoplasma sp.]|nr:hypoxanthine phosphoribosyltransferase [Mycoplasma sp.]
MNKINDERFEEILFTQEQIETRIKELANWINETYKDSKDLILVGLLKGSIPFIAQLMKDIKINHSIDFIIASSYFGGVKSTGNAKIIMDLNTDIFGKDVLIIEDIIDSGITLSKVKEVLVARNPKSLRIMTLLDKPSRRITKIFADVYGFEVPDKFLAGFGLDVKEKLRNLPYIGVFNKKYIDEL